MRDLPKAYLPADHEDHIKELWNNSGFFNPDNLPLDGNAKTYTIIFPPPNITDRLHLGHASILATQDLLIRFHRMNGYRTLWLPGTDHAAIATQAVVERRIFQEEGKTRHDLGRAELLKRVHSFVDETQATIISQIKGFGASMDWSRVAFTLDETRQHAVRKMFVDMYEAGVIYRGERIVNWCPRCQSTLADDEVEYKAEKTVLYTFKYWQDFPILISTTRPETKLGDTAVAVNPKDERYKSYIGKEFTGDFCGQKLTLKVIADREVDSTFGTGALGVTPAHSAIDWRMAELNNLPIVKVINELGKIHEGFGEYSGLTAASAREAIVEKLRSHNLIEKEEEIEHNISVCYRCGTVIEPLPSKQWFVAVSKGLDRFGGKSLKEKALEASKNLSVHFVPDRFKKRYEDWMGNLRDWCISRQIWFGHSIPVWYKDEEVYVGLSSPEGEGWKQDPDTLDTWFSSGMWTFSTLGWPDNFREDKKLGDLAAFHPTQVLGTGYEIITLWVSRMIMMSLFALGEIPFEQVYLQGMVLDKHGKKMSKSKGNGLDPLVVGAEYGTDAVRLSLLIGNTPGVDVRVSEEKIASFRNFANKLWNVSRYILSQEYNNEAIDYSRLTEADAWILSRLETTITEVSSAIEGFDFSQAGESLRRFTLDDLADWYIEASKFDGSTQKISVLYYILEIVLKLWHPFMPFITETIWQLAGRDSLLLVASWPTAKGESSALSSNSFELVRDIIGAIRNLRAEHRLQPGQKIKAIIHAAESAPALQHAAPLIVNLKTGIGELIIVESGERIPNALFVSIRGVDIYLEAAIDSATEKVRLQKEIEKVLQGIALVNAKLNNQDFISKAPAALVDAEKKKLAQYSFSLEKLREAVDNC